MNSSESLINFQNMKILYNSKKTYFYMCIYIFRIAKKINIEKRKNFPRLKILNLKRNNQLQHRLRSLH